MGLGRDPKQPLFGIKTPAGIFLHVIIGPPVEGLTFPTLNKEAIIKSLETQITKMHELGWIAGHVTADVVIVSPEGDGAALVEFGSAMKIVDLPGRKVSEMVELDLQMARNIFPI